MERLPEPMAADMRAFIRWTGAASPGAHVVEHPGVLGSVVPIARDRSVLNSVVYESTDALEAALAQLAAAYAASGVRAWTVWVPSGDRRAAELLARAGHALDAEPAAMVCRLDELDTPDPDDLDWTDEGDLSELAALNDEAYEHHDGAFTLALQLLDPSARVFLARRDGRTLSALCTLEAGGSAGVYWVATRPEARGAGLAPRLLGLALAAARRRGCATATLQATKMGAPVYERMGFRGVGVLEMWERREAP